MDIRRENVNGRLDFFHLHWPRDQKYFELGEKILSVRKCTTPTFTYTLEEVYVMMSFNIIKSERINMKYLTALLNSKLIKFWLKNKGKMQGQNFQIDKDPLLNIPIIISEFESEIILLFNSIKNSHNDAIKINDIINQIDRLIYKTLNMNEKEISLIENQLM